jgi:hypothetical protein
MAAVWPMMRPPSLRNGGANDGVGEAFISFIIAAPSSLRDTST